LAIGRFEKIVWRNFVFPRARKRRKPGVHMPREPNDEPRASFLTDVPTALCLGYGEELEPLVCLWSKQQSVICRSLVRKAFGGEARIMNYSPSIEERHEAVSDPQAGQQNTTSDWALLEFGAIVALVIGGVGVVVFVVDMILR
jgi:hypothetical protein